MVCPSCNALNEDRSRFCTGCGELLPRSQPNPVTPAPGVAVATAASELTEVLTDAGSLTGLVLAEKYRIDAKIGAGGMGTVYRATRLLIGDSVAVKILHSEQVSDPNAAERFRREAQAAARLKHANAVAIYDFGVSEDGRIYLVMELVEGRSLRSILDADGPLNLPEAVEIMRQICAALDEAHRQGIVHRDIKPDNIVVCDSPSGQRVKVLDFGIAKLRDVAASALTQTGNVMGTPYYMSPEQCLGEEIDGRSDIYSLGIVLYEILTGVVPFKSPSVTAVIVQHVNQAPPPLRSLNPAIPSPVEAVVLRALEKKREARQQTAASLARELTAALTRGYDTAPMREQPGTPPLDQTIRIATPSFLKPAVPQTFPSTIPGPAFAIPGTERALSFTQPEPRKRYLAFVAAGATLVLVLAVAALVMLKKSDQQSVPPVGQASNASGRDVQSSLASGVSDPEKTRPSQPHDANQPEGTGPVAERRSAEDRPPLPPRPLLSDTRPEAATSDPRVFAPTVPSRSSPPNRPPTVTLEVDGGSTTVEQGRPVRFHAQAQDPDGDQLQFDWASSAGSGTIRGNGSQATLDTQAVTGPVTITLTVYDQRGHQSSVSERITVAPRPPAVTSADRTFRVAHDHVGAFGSWTSKAQPFENACIGILRISESRVSFQSSAGHSFDLPLNSAGIKEVKRNSGTMPSGSFHIKPAAGNNYNLMMVDQNNRLLDSSAIVGLIRERLK